MDMHTKLPLKMAKNFCCHSDKKFNYFCCSLSIIIICNFAGAVKPVNDILGRNLDHSACIIIMDIDYVILQCSQLGSMLHYPGQ